MSKKDARRRVRDEEALALGGGLGGLGEEGKGRRRSGAGGWEDEFGDVLRDVGRSSGRSLGGDGYEELRQRGKRGGVLERSRESKKRGSDHVTADIEVPQKRKKSRFETERKSVKAKR